ncbi:hypothetical protein MRB53_041532 [Persea americana]|nr:hypothetical protein MRB53_041532 [Persea americana]
MAGGLDMTSAGGRSAAEMLSLSCMSLDYDVGDEVQLPRPVSAAPAVPRTGSIGRQPAVQASGLEQHLLLTLRRPRSRNTLISPTPTGLACAVRVSRRNALETHNPTLSADPSRNIRSHPPRPKPPPATNPLPAHHHRHGRPPLDGCVALAARVADNHDLQPRARIASELPDEQESAGWGCGVAAETDWRVSRIGNGCAETLVDRRSREEKDALDSQQVTRQTDARWPKPPSPVSIAIAPQNLAHTNIRLSPRLFGFLLGTVLAGSGLYYYVVDEYKVSNGLLVEDIYVRHPLSLTQTTPPPDASRGSNRSISLSLTPSLGPPSRRAAVRRLCPSAGGPGQACEGEVEGAQGKLTSTPVRERVSLCAIGGGISQIHLLVVTHIKNRCLPNTSLCEPRINTQPTTFSPQIQPHAQHPSL